MLKSIFRRSLAAEHQSVCDSRWRRWLMCRPSTSWIRQRGSSWSWSQAWILVLETRQQTENIKNTWGFTTSGWHSVIKLEYFVCVLLNFFYDLTLTSTVFLLFLYYTIYYIWDEFWSHSFCVCSQFVMICQWPSCSRLKPHHTLGSVKWSLNFADLGLGSWAVVALTNVSDEQLVQSLSGTNCCFPVSSAKMSVSTNNTWIFLHHLCSSFCHDNTAPVCFNVSAHIL